MSVATASQIGIAAFEGPLLRLSRSRNMHSGSPWPKRRTPGKTEQIYVKLHAIVAVDDFGDVDRHTFAVGNNAMALGSGCAQGNLEQARRAGISAADDQRLMRLLDIVFR